jgi:hypothetical protein
MAADINSKAAMKEGQEALSQYNELADALRQIGIGWVVAEVEDILSRGKEVPFRDLSEDQQLLYERRLNDETIRGFQVGKAKANDTIGVPYGPDERLALLVSATQRVIDTSVRSNTYVSAFAIRHNMHEVILEQPVGADIAATTPERRAIPIAIRSDVDELLNALNAFFNERVLD